MFALSKHPDIFVQYFKCSLYQQLVGDVNKSLRCTFFLLFFISFMFSWLDTSPPGFGSIGLWDIRYGSVDVLDWLCKKHCVGLLRKRHGKECCTNSNIAKKNLFTWLDICIYFLQGNTVVCAVPGFDEEIRGTKPSFIQIKITYHTNQSFPHSSNWHQTILSWRQFETEGHLHSMLHCNDFPCC